MLSNETWNILVANGKKEYKPMLGKYYRDKESGFVGKAYNYTLCGQLFLRNGKGYITAWAKNCEEVAKP